MSKENSGSLLVYDGDCSFCAACIRWYLDWADAPAATIPWQNLKKAELAMLGISASLAEESVWWIEPSGKRHRANHAVAMALLSGHGPLKLAGSAMEIPLLNRLAAVGYFVVARNRRHLGRGPSTCGT